MTGYKRFWTRVVSIGNIPMGGSHPIRIQSMTNTNTLDTEATVEQTIRLVDAGCDYVRITAPSIKEAEHLGIIRKKLVSKGYRVPLIADIHFTPKAAEIAARLVDKVRINPGNYVDRKKFEQKEYDDSNYQAELDRIRKRFTPLVRLCRDEGTVLRIGANHGSLSDRILNRYGDTPLGMVESALEFVRICEDEHFHDIVLSMKASNTRVMIQAYRLLVKQMESEGMNYPLHLGVTEAGDGDDGRIKSALGIGSLLEDGLGDTIRVSLTEPPENEIPVAKALVTRNMDRQTESAPDSQLPFSFDLYHYHRRPTNRVLSIGNEQVPVVVADLSKEHQISHTLLKQYDFHLSDSQIWTTGDQSPDILYLGSTVQRDSFPDDVIILYDHSTWMSLGKQTNAYPVFTLDEYVTGSTLSSRANFIRITASETEHSAFKTLKDDRSIVFILNATRPHSISEYRSFFFKLIRMGFSQPVILHRSYKDLDREDLMLYAATDFGSLFTDGLGDGIWISPVETSFLNNIDYNSVAFGILQASRTRMTRTEYIACPSCGRTLFDLEKTTANIRKRTDHLKGVKIGIMGCIVNGPGEMADADFGYVGSGPGKISLYHGQKMVKDHIPEAEAVDALISLIKQHGKWVDP